jgi:hypothetical protein
MPPSWNGSAIDPRVRGDGPTPGGGMQMAPAVNCAMAMADAYVIQRNPALERFFLALSGCLRTGTDTEPAPDLAATPPT